MSYEWTLIAVGLSLGAFFLAVLMLTGRQTGQSKEA